MTGRDDGTDVEGTVEFSRLVTLTEIDELFYRERRRVELGIEVQHLGHGAQTPPRELHFGKFYTLNGLTLRSPSESVAFTLLFFFFRQIYYYYYLFFFGLSFVGLLLLLL